MAGSATDLITIIGGLSLLGGLGWLIGRIEANARDGAWRRIAAARRRLYERDREFIACLDRPRCEHCPAGRYLRDHYGDLEQL